MPKHTNFSTFGSGINCAVDLRFACPEFLVIFKGFLAPARIKSTLDIRALKNCHCTALRVVNLSFFKDVIVVID